MNKFLIAALAACVAVAACGGSGSTPTTAPQATTTLFKRGTITGFGSVIVDGIHYDVSQARIKIDGATGQSQNGLNVGQRVTVSGTVDNTGNHVANEVEYEAELHGAVTAIDVPSNSFVALGQTVRVDSATIYNGLTGLAALAVGDLVEVSGSRLVDNTLLATYVEHEQAQAESELRGTIASLDTAARRFSIGTQVIDYGNAALSPSGFVPANGIIVEVEGVLQGTVLVAARVRSDNDVGESQSGSEAEVGGVIHDLAADHSSFMIDSTLIRVSATTTYQDGTAATLANGFEVQADGVLQADNSVLASKIEFEESGDVEHTGGQIDGTVSALDRTANTVTVLGDVIAIDDTTVFLDSRDGSRTFTFATLAVGDYVEVGFNQVAGKRTASRIERENASTVSKVEGFVDSFTESTQTIVIDGVTVDASAATYTVNDQPATATQFYTALKVGDRLEASGTYGTTSLAATEVQREQQN